MTSVLSIRFTLPGMVSPQPDTQGMLPKSAAESTYVQAGWGYRRCTRLASPSLNRPPAGVCYPHVGNCTGPVVCPHNLSRHRREPGAHEAGQEFDIKSVGQHQRFGTATRPGAIEHFEQAALIFAKGRQGSDQRL